MVRPKEIIQQIQNRLDLIFPQPSHKAIAQAADFVSAQHRHHAYQVSDLKARPDVVCWVEQAYTVLAEIAAGNICNSESMLDAVHSQFDTACTAIKPYLDHVDSARIHCQSELSKIKHIELEFDKLKKTTLDREQLITKQRDNLVKNEATIEVLQQDIASRRDSE